MVPQHTVVTRDGILNDIDVRDLAVGDIVQIKLGDKIPADIRLIQCEGLKVDNSSFTGETEAQKRSINCTHDNIMETQNICFFSTSVIEGTTRNLYFKYLHNTLMV